MMSAASDCNDATVDGTVIETFCGSPTRSVQGQLRSKRPASPALTFDSQSSVGPPEKKPCFSTNSRSPQQHSLHLFGNPFNTKMLPALPSHSACSLGEDSTTNFFHAKSTPVSLSRATPCAYHQEADTKRCLSTISFSGQQQSSFTAADYFPCRAGSAFTAAASACGDDDDIDEAESCLVPASTPMRPPYTHASSSASAPQSLQHLPQRRASHITDAFRSMRGGRNLTSMRHSNHKATKLQPFIVSHQQSLQSSIGPPAAIKVRQLHMLCALGKCTP